MISQEAQNRYRRERYAKDPAYREAIAAASKARRCEINARRKLRYRHDEAYRQKCIEASRQHREAAK